MKSKRLQNFEAGQENLTKRLQKVQDKLDKTSKEIADMLFIGGAGGGVVEVTLKGDKAISKIEIKDKSRMEELLNDVEMLFDLIIAAYNDASKKIDDYTDNRISDITKGLPLPGLS